MLVWLIKDGETLPIQAGTRRMRTGLLAAELVHRGHSVFWWSSTFSHQRKVLLCDHDCEVKIEPSFTLKLVHAGSYRNHISFQRYRHHRVLAHRFRQQAETMPKPDVIVSAFPTIDLAYEASQYARSRRVPIIVDIRDLWPDVFIDKTPRFLQWLARILLTGEFNKTKYLLRSANSLVAVSQGYLNWSLRHAGRQQVESDKLFYIGFPDAIASEHEASVRIQSLRERVAGKVVFVFIGSFGYSYELDLVCEVARRMLAMKLDHIHFVLVGDGQQFDTISRKAATLPNITLTGWLNQAELSDVLAISDVGLVPCLSVADTLPNKPFEYLSAGLPVLSSLEGEMAQIISDHEVGYSYSCGDATSLCDYIVKLAEDSALRQRLARNSKVLFESRFRAEVIYSTYASHIEQIVDKYHV